MLFKSSEKPVKARVISATVHQSHLLCLASGAAGFEFTESGTRGGETWSQPGRCAGCCTRKSQQPRWAPHTSNIKRGANNVLFKTTVQSNGKAEPCTASASLVVCWKQEKQKKMQLYVDLETRRKREKPSLQVYQQPLTFIRALSLP